MSVHQLPNSNATKYDKYRKRTKFVTNLIVGIGTTKIVSGVVKNNTNPETKTDKVTVAAGSFVLGGIATDATSKYTDTFIDKFFDNLPSFKKSIEDAKDEIAAAAAKQSQK